jgi:hypothetical protein
VEPSASHSEMKNLNLEQRDETFDRAGVYVYLHKSSNIRPDDAYPQLVFMRNRPFALIFSAQILN